MSKPLAMLHATVMTTLLFGGGHGVTGYENINKTFKKYFYYPLLLFRILIGKIIILYYII